MSDFLIEPGMLGKGRIHLLSGSPASGKSTLLAQLIGCFLDPSKSFLSGLAFEKLAPEEIGIIFTDRLLSDNMTWLKAFGVDVPVYSIPNDSRAVGMLNSHTEVRVNYLYGVELFKYALSQLPSTVKLVICDVFTSCFIGKNIHDQDIVYRHMVSLLSICEQLGITVIGTAYGSKQKGGQQDRYVRLVDRIIGAATLRGCATDLAYLTTKEETGATEGYQEFHWVSRHSAPRAFAIERMENGQFREKEEVILTPDTTTSPLGVNQQLLTKTQQIILDKIPYNLPLTILEIVDAVKSVASQATVYRAITKFLQTNALVTVSEEDERLIRKLDS